MTHSVNVRTIAEAYYEGGDLCFELDAAERMQEGLKGHVAIQSAYPAGYKSEVPLRLTLDVCGMQLTVQGRADGLLETADTLRVEEIKTTRMPLADISENDFPVHWAQAEMYGFMLCELRGRHECEVCLVYADLEGGRTVFARAYTQKRLKELFLKYAAVYAGRLKQQDQWREVSVPSVKTSPFPFESFRDGQRTFAEYVYRAVRDGKKLLCEAPTGIGKTAAALFPAVKAIGENLTDTVFYLTARTTGRLAAENTLALMRAKGHKIRSVTVSAKRKVCPTPLAACDPDVCPRAKGYFDRQKTALAASWQRSAYDERTIRQLADEYSLCPFELSLALSETAQIIICDYNYVFDPAVRLRRFFDRSGRYTLLIDEAHNLPARAREMYSAEIGYTELSALRRSIGSHAGKQCELYKDLTDVLKQLGIADECELRSELPLKLVNALKAFVDTAKPYIGRGGAYEQQLTNTYFAACTFIRVSGEYDSDTYKTLVLPEGKRNRIRLWCWNPTPRLEKTFKRMRGCAMFSATLSPLEHYAAMLAADEGRGDRLLSLPSPFPRENLLALALEIPTRYSRREESAHAVARAIHTLALSRTGNYLACFPSHAYMNLVAGIFTALEPRVDVLVQKRDMNEREREEYIAAFTEKPRRSLAAFIAMGGVFSEGIDLPGDRLIGAAIVGVGLPQIGFERDCLKTLYDDDEGEGGFERAYMYPGIGKCLQAAGRVIRTETDTGVVLFIDERYKMPEYARLLPEHMKPKSIARSELGERLKRFWARRAAEKQ